MKPLSKLEGRVHRPDPKISSEVLVTFWVTVRFPVSTPVPVLGGAVRLIDERPPERTSRRSFRNRLSTIAALRRRLTVHGLAIRVHVSAVRRATAFRLSRSVTT